MRVRRQLERRSVEIKAAVEVGKSLTVVLVPQNRPLRKKIRGVGIPGTLRHRPRQQFVAAVQRHRAPGDGRRIHSRDNRERLLSGKVPGLPRLGFSIVDVRDVADLHIAAMIAPQAAGQRFIAAGDFAWMTDVAALLRARLGSAAGKVPTRKLPDFVVRFAIRAIASGPVAGSPSVSSLDLSCRGLAAFLAMLVSPVGLCHLDEGDGAS